MAKNSASNLIKEIGLLLQCLIEVYINKHDDGSRANFLNSFLVVPDLDDLNPSILMKSYKAKEQFDEYVSSGLIQVSLINVYVDDDFVLNFYLELILLFIDDDSDPVYVDLKHGDLTSLNNELEELLQQFKIDKLAELTKEIRNNRTIRLLKDN